MKKSIVVLTIILIILSIIYLLFGCAINPDYYIVDIILPVTSGDITISSESITVNEEQIIIDYAIAAENAGNQVTFYYPVDYDSYADYDALEFIVDGMPLAPQLYYISVDDWPDSQGFFPPSIHEQVKSKYMSRNFLKDVDTIEAGYSFTDVSGWYYYLDPERAQEVSAYEDCSIILDTSEDARYFGQGFTGTDNLEWSGGPNSFFYVLNDDNAEVHFTSYPEDDIFIRQEMTIRELIMLYFSSMQDTYCEVYLNYLLTNYLSIAQNTTGYNDFITLFADSFPTQDLLIYVYDYIMPATLSDISIILNYPAPRDTLYHIYGSSSKYCMSKDSSTNILFDLPYDLYDGNLTAKDGGGWEGTIDKANSLESYSFSYYTVEEQEERHRSAENLGEFFDTVYYTLIFGTIGIFAITIIVPLLIFSIIMEISTCRENKIIIKDSQKINLKNEKT